jgi:hypothetical protein
MISYADTLEEAAHVIETHGWQRDRYHGRILDPRCSSEWTPGTQANTGPHCLVGAIVRAHAELTGDSADEELVARRYAEHRTGRLIEINQYLITGQAAAAAWLRQRAKMLREA